MTYLLTLNNDPNPATLRYMEEHAKPFMAANGLEFHTVHPTLASNDLATISAKEEK